MIGKAMFEDAQVGDRVWDFRYGFGEIILIAQSKNYPLRVKFPYVDGAMTYTLDGKHYSNEAFLSLFWDEIKFDIPPSPKRKVKKIIEGWVNVYPDCFGQVCETKGLAIKVSSSGTLGQHHIVFEYEEEE
jgi:hypothetical protein